MPEIYKPINLMDLFSDNELLKGLNCCPIKIWYAFVVETDSSITNIEVCSRMIACNDSLISTETAILNERVKALFEKTKSSSGILNGEKVAVACIRNIHYECME